MCFFCVCVFFVCFFLFLFFFVVVVFCFCFFVVVVFPQIKKIRGSSCYRLGPNRRRGFGMLYESINNSNYRFISLIFRTSGALE